MCRDQSKSQVASETGTEDWGQDNNSANQQGSDANWSTNATRGDDNRAQSPQSSNTQGGGEGEGEVASTAAKPSNTQKGAASSTTTTASGGGSGEKQHKDTMVFSLSRANDLVTHYTSKRGKARGRGQRSGGGPPPHHRVGGGGGSSGGFSGSSASAGAGDKSPTTPTKTRFAPPKPGSGGITVIEPLEKRLQKQQQQKQQQEEDQEKKVGSDGQSVEGSPSSARPTSASKSTPQGPSSAVATANSGSGSGESAESASKSDKGGGGGGAKNRPGSGRSPSSSTAKDGGQPTTSKPKRYSSQRQKGWSFSKNTTVVSYGKYLREKTYMYVRCYAK